MMYVHRTNTYQVRVLFLFRDCDIIELDVQVLQIKDMNKISCVIVLTLTAPDPLSPAHPQSYKDTDYIVIVSGWPTHSNYVTEKLK